ERGGRPVFEELFGREGFTGPSSLLYHLGMPEAAHDVVPGADDRAAMELEQVHTHAHLEACRMQPEGDIVSGRGWLLVNDDVRGCSRSRRARSGTSALPRSSSRPTVRRRGC